MKNIISGRVVGSLTVVLLLAMQSTANAQNYKCKGSDGKIEYRDRACETDKESLSKPRATAGVSTAPAIASMKQLETLLADYEQRLCERERLATEVDIAQRSGELKKAESLWKLRQERLNLLNDNLIEFQSKASKVTKGTASDSPEMMAVRNFQRKLKGCAVVKK